MHRHGQAADVGLRLSMESGKDFGLSAAQDTRAPKVLPSLPGDAIMRSGSRRSWLVQTVAVLPEMEMTIRILIADDHGVVRQGIRMFLGLDPEFEVVGEAKDGIEALELTKSLKPDVVLMDLLMPQLDGIQATAAIRRDHPKVEVVALTSVLQDASVVEAIRAGATGYVLKDADADELCRTIRAAAAGQVQLSPKVAARLVREVRAPDDSEQLTEREVEVLRLIAMGKSNKEIAQSLHIGEKTVKTHVSNILAKLRVPNRTHAALHAARIGLVSLE